MSRCPLKNICFCFISIVWVHFSQKTEKFWFLKSLKYFITFFDTKRCGVRFEYVWWPLAANKKKQINKNNQKKKKKELKWKMKIKKELKKPTKLSWFMSAKSDKNFFCSNKKNHEITMPHECQIWYLVTRLYILRNKDFLDRL